MRLLRLTPAHTGNICGARMSSHIWNRPPRGTCFHTVHEARGGLFHYVAISLTKNNVTHAISKCTPRNIALGYFGSRAMSTAYKPCWKLQRAVFLTNDDRWHEKPEGIHYAVEYIDTCALIPTELRSAFPVVLAVPASPGSHRDLLPLVAPLVHEGCRVIIPNFPGFGHCTSLVLKQQHLRPSNKSDVFFTHTSSERGEFLIRFLMTLDIGAVDLALAHSTGASPLLLLLNASDMVRASLFINAMPMHKPIKGSRPLWLTNVLVQMHGGDIMRVLANLSTKAIMKWKGLAGKSNEERYCILQLALGHGGGTTPAVVRSFAKSDKPFSYIYTTKDPYIRFKTAKEYADMLGISEETTLFLEPGKEWKSFGFDCRKRALLFKMNSHYPHFNPEIRKYILDEIIHLLRISTASQYVVSP